MNIPPREVGADVDQHLGLFLLQRPAIERVFLGLLARFVVCRIRQRALVLLLELFVDLERAGAELEPGEFTREDKELEVNLMCSWMHEAHLASLSQADGLRITGARARSVADGARVDLEPYSRHLEELDPFAPVAQERVRSAQPPHKRDLEAVRSGAIWQALLDKLEPLARPRVASARPS